MIDILEQNEMLERVIKAAKEGKIKRVINMCEIRVALNNQMVKDFEAADAKEAYESDIRRQDAKAAVE